VIRIRCRCGETFHAEEQHVGRVLHCRCGRDIPVRLPPARREAAGTTPDGAAADGMWRRLRSGIAVARRTLPAAPPVVLRGLGWAIWAYAALVGLVCVVLWTLGERWWPATVYLFGPRWVVLLPLALLIPAAALLRPRLLLPLLAAALVMLFPVMGLRTGWRSWAGGEPAPGTLRVVSLNAAGEPWAAERLIARVEEWRPQVAAVQECTDPVAEAFGRLRGWTLRRDGQLCLLSRFPLRGAEVMDRSRFDLVRDAGIGGTSAAVRYTLDTPGGPVQLVNLHLETPRKGLEGVLRGSGDRVESNAISREIESRVTSRWAAQGQLPLLVAGDFNLPVESRIYRESWGGFTNAFSRAGRGFGFTRFNGWIRVRIDHVLAGPGWRVDRAFVGPDVGSDHRPVVVDLVQTGGG
jgi:endonuclease/exonuclease/phosphatase (EEP) superfamily protein YafD